VATFVGYQQSDARTRERSGHLQPVLPGSRWRSIRCIHARESGSAIIQHRSAWGSETIAACHARAWALNSPACWRIIEMVPVGFGCRPKAPPELAIKVLLTSIPQFQCHGFDLHTGTNLRSAEHHARSRDVFMHRQADLIAKQAAYISGLPSKDLRKDGESNVLIVVSVDLVEHALDVLTCGG
jgi:hypothetical protein